VTASDSVALYVRVSTSDQDLAGQERDLRAYAASRGWRVASVYAEKVTGTGKAVPGAYEQLLRDSKKSNPGWRRVLVWALDRWSRDPSFVQAIGSIEQLERQGVLWHSLKEPQLDSGEDSASTLGRDLLRGILPTIAAFEAQRRSERTRVAMKEIREGRRATRSGRPPGRQRKVTEQKARRLTELREGGMQWPQVAQEVGLAAGTCRRVFSLQRRGLPLFNKPCVQKGTDPH
jgi:DNA invertase Pin-like site-specific DNA recombinase